MPSCLSSIISFGVIPFFIMVAEKNVTGLEAVDLHHTIDRSDNEKSAAIYNDNSDLSSSGVGDYDDLPDPDAGKSDEERAKLVRFPDTPHTHRRD